MSQSIKTIEESLNIDSHEYFPETSNSIIETVDSNLEEVSKIEDTLDDDFVIARNNLLEMIKDAKEEIKNIRSLAFASEDPRAWQAWTTALKTLMDLNNNLVSLYEKRNKSLNTKEEKDKEDEKPQQVTNNTLFVGSGRDLNKFIKELKNGEIDVNDITQSSQE